MKNYLSLIPIQEKVRGKQTRMVRLCIIFSVFLIAAIFGMADMDIRGMKIQTTLSDGAWHAAFRSLSDEQVAIVAARPEFVAGSRYAVINYRLDMGYKVNGISTCIFAFDEDFMKLYPAISIIEGTFPQGGRDVTVTENMARQQSLSIGDEIVLSTPKGEDTFYICSIMEGNAGIEQAGAYGIFMNTDAYFNCFKDVTESRDIEYFVQFTDRCNIQKTIADICNQLGIEKEQVGQNAKLLGLMLQSGDNYILFLYLTAAILAVLVAFSGMLMILGSLNSNVAQRTEFFGMMRCLGACGKQVKHFVRLEALSWCKTAIPIGLALSIVVVWGLCIMLKMISPTYFGAMPTFGISLIGIVSGTVIGILTVLIAANAPAKKASRVSPLTAVSGNADTVFEAKRAANTRFFHVETALGIHHAAGSKKNLFLLAGSFAFSIILFLGFSTMVDFMNHAIVGIRPYTPDVSVVSPDNSCSIPRELFDELSQDTAVKRVFARSFAYDMAANETVDAHVETVQVNLISYETYQFMWAEEYLIEGDINAVKDGKGVMAVYDSQKPLKIGDSITFETPQGTQKVVIYALLSYSPFDREENEEAVICSEALFCQITGENGYTVIDIQLAEKSDAAVERIEEIAAKYTKYTFSDRRKSNSEARGIYFSFALLVYGFLLIVALIAAFNIINSIAMSVSARMHQYGTMRAIGIMVRQLKTMVVAETAVYLIWGIVAGLALGLPLHWFLYDKMITARWGNTWSFPFFQFCTIAAVMLISAVLSIIGPIKRIRGMSIKNCQQFF